MSKIKPKYQKKLIHNLYYLPELERQANRSEPSVLRKAVWVCRRRCRVRCYSLVCKMHFLHILYLGMMVCRQLHSIENLYQISIRIVAFRSLQQVCPEDICQRSRRVGCTSHLSLVVGEESQSKESQSKKVSARISMGGDGLLFQFCLTGQTRDLRFDFIRQAWCKQMSVA